MKKKIGIIGAGAVGCSLGSRLYKTYANDFYFVAQGSRAQRLRKDGIVVNNERLYPKVCSRESGEKMDLLLLCVKNYSLQQTLKDMASAVSKGTIILP